MKYLGVDYSAKDITFEVDGRWYSVHFRDTFLNGTYDISVWGKNGKTNAKIISAYPNLWRRIIDMALITKMEIKFAIKRLLQHK